MLNQIRVPRTDEMINDCLHDEGRRRVQLDMSTLAELYDQLGIERGFVV